MTARTTMHTGDRAPVAPAPLIGADEVIEELGEWRPRLDALLAEAERTPAARRDDIARRIGEFVLETADRVYAGTQQRRGESCDCCAGTGRRYAGGPDCAACFGEGVL